MAGRAEPRFVEVAWLPRAWIKAMTLPPFGVLVRRGADSAGLRAHELVHWDQYRQRGTVMFYLGYLAAWVRAGFSYTRHPWEIEARERSGH